MKVFQSTCCLDACIQRSMWIRKTEPHSYANTNVGTDAKASGFHNSERFSNLMSKLFYDMHSISWYAGRTESEE